MKTLNVRLIPSIKKLALAFIGLILCPYCSVVLADPLDCSSLRSVVDFRTGVQLWDSGPVVGVARDDGVWKANVVDQMQSIAKSIWRYVSLDCAYCERRNNSGPSIIISTFDTPANFPFDPGLFIVSPEQIKPNIQVSQFIDEAKGRGVQILVSAMLAEHTTSEKGDYVLVVVPRNVLESEYFMDEITGSLFESLTSLRISYSPDMKRSFSDEMKRGCLEGASDNCPVLKFGRFLYSMLKSHKDNFRSVGDEVDWLCRAADLGRTR